LLALISLFFVLLRKSTTIVANRAALFGSDINQIVRRLRPQTPTGGAYSAAPDPLAVFSRPTVLVREGRERKEREEGRGREGREGGRGGEERERKGVY